MLLCKVGIHPKYLILSERMGSGETLEELAEKARKIIESTLQSPDKLLCDDSLSRPV